MIIILFEHTYSQTSQKIAKQVVRGIGFIKGQISKPGETGLIF
jgi:hypothetical protein